MQILLGSLYQVRNLNLVVFYTIKKMSTLFVNNISHTNDTSAMTINSTGTITPSKMVFFRVDHVTI